MAITTARDVITKAMRRVNILGAGEAPTAEEAQDALDMLNSIISEWSIDNTMTLTRVQESYALPANISAVTIGTGQTWDTEKPFFIVSAFIRSGGFDYPIETITRDNYDAITDKSETGRPTVLFYDPGLTQQANQLGTINLHPVPDIAYSLFITSDKGLSEFASLNSDLTFPSFYKRALIYNLAVELSLEYGRVLPGGVAAIAQQSKATIAALNAKQKVLIKALGLPGSDSTFDFYSGD